MPLSANEARILQELEDDLKAADPKLAKAFGAGGRFRQAVRLTLLGTVVMGLGMGLMIYALAFKTVPLGVLAFAVMAAGAYTASPSSVRFRGRRGWLGTKKNLKRGTEPRSTPDQ